MEQTNVYKGVYKMSEAIAIIGLFFVIISSLKDYFKKTNTQRKTRKTTVKKQAA